MNRFPWRLWRGTEGPRGRELQTRQAFSLPPKGVATTCGSGGEFRGNENGWTNTHNAWLSRTN